MDMRKIEQKLARAKASLVLEQPFFAALLLKMPLICDAQIPTMATNGVVIKFSPSFVYELDHDEIKFVLCHEIMHPAFQHHTRRQSRDPKRWNAAADYIINGMLISEKIGKMPKGGLHNDALVTAGGGLAEGVYALLPDDKGGDKGGGSGGQPTFPNGNGSQGSSFDELEDAPGGDAEKAANEAEWKVSVAQAAQAAKMHGKLSSGLRQFVADALRPVVDWRDILRRFIQQRSRVEPSFARPKRRWLAEDLILPSMAGEDMGELVIAVDCSGSTMIPHIIAAFSAEVRAIHEDVRPSKTDVIYWDTRILGHDTFGPDDELKVNLTGGGGTTFSQVVEHIQQSGINPACMVVLTDLYIGQFGPPLDFPVLWVSNGADTAPWGEVVKMDPRHL